MPTFVETNKYVPDMKTPILVIAAMMLAGTAAAQNYAIKQADIYESADGVVLPDLNSTVAVDITVVADRVVAGPYARYAQKYLGVRAPLSDKTTYEIESAKVALLGDESAYPVAGPLPATQVSNVGFDGSATEFAKILPDRMSAANVDSESAARAAAAEIFKLRRQRLDLITGETGENVFGAGLKDALKEIHALEDAYTALFLGKHSRTTETRRYTVNPSADRTSYILCRFAMQSGLLPANDLSGDVVLLQIRPTGELAVQGLRQASSKERAVKMRVADNSVCTVVVNSDEIAQSVLPIFAFGKNIDIAVPRR